MDRETFMNLSDEQRQAELNDALGEMGLRSEVVTEEERDPETGEVVARHVKCFVLPATYRPTTSETFPLKIAIEPD